MTRPEALAALLALPNPPGTHRRFMVMVHHGDAGIHLWGITYLSAKTRND
jgi:hypothetical protein